MPNIKSIVSGQLSVVRKSKGFTLIELLIVISIIGILASLTLASYGSAQAKARDGVRKSDLAQLKRALELYKADCDSGSWYPNVTDNQIVSGSTLYALLAQSGAGATAVPYMNPVPKDPTNVSPLQYSYTPASGATTSGAVVVCPSSTGTQAQTGVASYYMKVRLERINDGDGLKSFNACSNKLAAGTTYTQGDYYVCNN